MELFIYLDSVYNAYKSHGGSAWWKYDEDFHRLLSLQPDIGWGVKATDVLFRLMIAQKTLLLSASGHRLQLWPCSIPEPAGSSTRAIVNSSAYVNISINAPSVVVLTQQPAASGNPVLPASPQGPLMGRKPVNVQKMVPWPLTF